MRRFVPLRYTISGQLSSHVSQLLIVVWWNMIKDLEHLVIDFNTEDYIFICNTAIKSIQMLIEKLRSMNTTVEDSDVVMDV